MTCQDINSNQKDNSLHTYTSRNYDSDMDISFHGNRPFLSCSDIVYPKKGPTILIYSPDYNSRLNGAAWTSTQGFRTRTNTSLSNLNLNLKHRPDTPPPENSNCNDSDTAPRTTWCLPCLWRATTRKWWQWIQWFCVWREYLIEFFLILHPLAEI